MTGNIRAVALPGLVLSFLCLGLVTSGRAADEPPKVPPKITFEEHVLPIFKARCVRCHAGAEPANEFRLTTRKEILRGGKSGPAMRIAAAESSLLWEKLASNAMPKGGPALSAEEKGIIRTWINEGPSRPTEKTMSRPNSKMEPRIRRPSTGHSDLQSGHPFPRFRLRAVLAIRSMRS